VNILSKKKKVNIFIPLSMGRFDFGFLNMRLVCFWSFRYVVGLILFLKNVVFQHPH
jgi:hypothetical protein